MSELAERKTIRRIFIEQVQSTLLGLRQTLSPATCYLCDRVCGGPTALCDRCERQIAPIQTACLRCGSPIHEAVGEPNSRCPKCRGGKWPAKRIVCFATYDGVVRDAVIQMKRPGTEGLAFYFADRMADLACQKLNVDAIDWVVPVPQHWIKRIQIRHNSSEVLALRVADRLGKKLAISALYRTRQTKKQGMMKASQRARNVEGSYAASSHWDWKGKHILLVDDIVTSGSTIAAIARPMLAAGAKRVDVLSVVRGYCNQSANVARRVES